MLTAANVVINLDDDDDDDSTICGNIDSELQITGVMSLSQTSNIVISDDDEPVEVKKDEEKPAPIKSSGHRDENSNRPKLTIKPLHQLKQSSITKPKLEPVAAPKRSLSPGYSPPVPAELPKPKVFPVEPLFNKGYQDVFREYFNIPQKHLAPKPVVERKNEIIYLESYVKDDDDKDEAKRNSDEDGEYVHLNPKKKSKGFVAGKKRGRPPSLALKVNANSSDDEPIANLKQSSGKPRSFTKKMLRERALVKRFEDSVPIAAESDGELNAVAHCETVMKTRSQRRVQNGTNGTAKFECTRCLEKFSSYLTLQEHIADEHVTHSPTPPRRKPRRGRKKRSSDEEFVEDQAASDDEIVEERVRKGRKVARRFKYQCTDCLEHFVSMGDLKYHDATAHECSDEPVNNVVVTVVPGHDPFASPKDPLECIEPAAFDVRNTGEGLVVKTIAKRGRKKKRRF